MASKLKKGEKQKIIEGLNELYKGNTAEEFVGSLLAGINASRAATPSTDAEKAKVEAAKKGAENLVAILPLFLRKKDELINQKFTEYKNKLAEIKTYYDGRSFVSDLSTITTAKNMIAEAKALRESFSLEQTHLAAVVTQCEAKGLIKESDKVTLSTIGKMPNAEAKAYLETAIMGCLEDDKLLDSMTSLTEDAKNSIILSMTANINAFNAELLQIVEDPAQLERDRAELINEYARRKMGGPGKKEGGPETRTEGGPETRTEGGPETRTEGGPETRTEGGPETRTEGGPETRTEGGPETRTEGGPETRTEGGPETRTEGGPGRTGSYIPSDEFKTKYTAFVTIINQKIKELVAQEKEVENSHALIAASSEVSLDALEEFVPRSNMAHSIEMAILEARKGLTTLEHEEYRKNPVYYAKFDSSLLGVAFDYDKLKEVYDGNIQEYYNEHVQEVNYALGEIEKERALATPDPKRLASLQEFVVAEKSTINRHLMGYASIHKDFDLKAFLATNKDKFKAVEKGTVLMGGPDRTEGGPDRTEGGPDRTDTATTEEIKAHLTILYKEIAKAFIEKYTIEGVAKGVSFEQYFQTEFIKFIAEFKTKAKSGKFDNLDVNKEGHLVWVEKGIELPIDFKDFARVLIETSREELKSKLQTDFDAKGKAKAKLTFNTKNKNPEQVDTTKAIVVNAIISNEMFEMTEDGKRRIKRSFVDKIVASGLQLSAGGKNLSAAEASGFIFEAPVVEGEQTIVIDVKDPSGKQLCQITVQMNPDLVHKSGMGM